jgi:hypothetical protein
MLDSISHFAANREYYGGANDPYEAVKVIEAWKLGFNLGTVVKYIARLGKKPGASRSEDLEKALWYLHRELSAERVSGIAERSCAQ